MTNDDKNAIPFVGGIITKRTDEGEFLLIQTRWKPDRDPIYSGTIEFTAGTLDIRYENIYDALEREIKEETGLQLKRIINDDRTPIFRTDKDDAVFGFQPFCCTQQLKNGKPWIGFIFLCEVEDGEFIPEKDGVKDIHWTPFDEVKNLFEDNPDRFFTLEIPAWYYFFKMRDK